METVEQGSGLHNLSTLSNNARCSLADAVVCLKVWSRGCPKPVNNDQNNYGRVSVS